MINEKRLMELYEATRAIEDERVAIPDLPVYYLESIVGTAAVAAMLVARVRHEIGSMGTEGYILQKSGEALKTHGLM